MTVIFFLLNNFILLFLCLTIIYFLWKYPRTRFKKLFEVRNYKLVKYALKNNYNIYYNYFLYSIYYSCIFIEIFKSK